MPVHDTYARITPAELTFPDRETAEESFRAIAGEAEARGADPADPSVFVMLMEAGRALRALRGPGDEAERVREHGVLLYHLFHAWRSAAPLRLLDTRVVRLLLESEPWEAGPVEPPEPAGYVQLPQHLLWVRPAGGASQAAPGPSPGEGREDAPAGTPESADGLFWTVWEDRVSFLLAMGVRPDRPGFGVVPLDPVPLESLGGWIRETMREEGRDFGSAMPGAELERLYEVRTAGEVVKLAARLFRYLGSVDAGVEEPDEAQAPGRREDAPAEGAEAAGRGGPRRTARPWVRVILPR